jgi:hypothetical protein
VIDDVDDVGQTVFWNVAPRSLIDVCRRYRSAYCLHHQGDDEESSKYF